MLESKVTPVLLPARSTSSMEGTPLPFTSQTGDPSLSNAIQADGEILDRLPVFIEEAEAEIAHAGSIDNGASNHVSALVEREPFRHAIVHFHAPVGKEVDGFLAVDPPDRRPVDADGHARVLYLTRAVDHRHGPEDNTIGFLVQTIGEAKELDVEARGIERMPDRKSTRLNSSHLGIS